jgi:hypothetical protein
MIYSWEGFRSAINMRLSCAICKGSFECCHCDFGRAVVRLWMNELAPKLWY